MRVTESIKELRQICQYSRDNDYGKRPWPERKLQRPVSIYFTKLFLEIGISANQASLIHFIFIVAGGAFLTFPSPKYWFIGIALLWLCMIIGVVDGEIARYNKSASPKGAFCNSMPEQFGWLYIPICISFGIYGMFHNIYPFIFGFVAVISISLTTSALFLPYSILRDKGLLSEALGSDKATKPEGHTSIIIRYGRFFNHFTILLFVFLISTIVDCFISPFTIGSLSFNARYIGFIIYALVWLASAIRNIYLPLHTGLKLRL